MLDGKVKCGYCGEVVDRTEASLVSVSTTVRQLNERWPDGYTGGDNAAYEAASTPACLRCARTMLETQSTRAAKALDALNDERARQAENDE